MIEILHTHDRMQADLVRVALEAEGIRVEMLGDNYDPYLNRHVLAVSEADAPRAIAIRKRIEQQSGASRTKRPPLRVGVLAGIVVFWVVVYFFLRWFSR